jgi:DNA repair protein RecO (recombination protein O)
VHLPVGARFLNENRTKIHSLSYNNSAHGLSNSRFQDYIEYMIGSKPEKDEALVLRSLRHGETSRIVTLFTRRFGRLAMMAKGARRGKSGASGGAFETPALIEATMYIKATRSVQNLGQVSILNAYPNIKRDLILKGYASALLELICLCFTDEEANGEAFNAALETLQNFENGLGEPRVNLWRFQIKTLQTTGFAIDPVACPVCSLGPSEIGLKNLFWLQAGAVCCCDCRPPSGDFIPLSGESVRLLRSLVENINQVHQRLKPSAMARREISGVLERYMKFHIPNTGKTPAFRMLDRFENLTPATEKSVVNREVSTSRRST